MKNYKIAVVGLGLIGGSLCKAITKYTNHSCFGIDSNKDVIQKAISSKAIKSEISVGNLCEMDFVFIALYPKATIDFINQNENNFSENTIIIDCCGIKKDIIDNIKCKNINFIGGHPMAGSEKSGFSHSKSSLFKNAYFILTPTKTTDEIIARVKDLLLELGFCDVTITSASHHDDVIAFTSQLAHIVSSAYIKSPTLQKRKGFSAGSFADLTRVAELNADMWASLFLSNKEPLCNEIDMLIKHLNEYKMAIQNNDEEKLSSLLRIGNHLKITDKNN